MRRIWHNPRPTPDIDHEMESENQADGSLEAMTVRGSPNEIFKSSSDLNKASIDFLKIDLDTALSFAGIALQSTGDDEQRARNQNNARSGYDTVRRLISKVSPSRVDAELIEDKMKLLKSELMKLGERF